MKKLSNTYLSTTFLQTVKVMFRAFIILIVFASLQSCLFSENIAPTADRGQRSSTKFNHHVVKSGETLYAIAWRYGVDYKSLARANGIGSDFLIYAGQTLKLPNNAKLRHEPRRRLATSTESNKAPSATRRSKKTPKKSPVSKIVSHPSRQSATSTSRVKQRSEKKSSPASPASTKEALPSKIRWRWPTNGIVVTNFSAGKGTNKGIDIKGKKGDSVRAAALGRVVYAGSGLRGYGKLVIVKHNDTYLSAYAHNDRLRVKEGQFVKAGQHIADIGSSGSQADSVKLHFEIRRNGQPIDPLRLLPKRKT